MTLRKTLFPFLLSLLLLTSQQQAWAHALSHVAQDRVHSAAKQMPAEKLCQHCLAFAQIGAALQRAPILVTAMPFGLMVAPARLVVSAPACMERMFQPRAPPSSA